MVSLKDIAKEAGVSVATVSYILNDKKKFSREVEEKVRRVAKLKNYQPNTAAAALRKGVSDSIVLIVPDLSNPWFSMLSHNITKEVQKLGLYVTVFTSFYDEENEVNILARARKMNPLACLLVSSSNKIPKEYGDMPILLLDRAIPGFPCIYFDNYNGGYQQGQHILSVGAKNILILCNPNVSTTAAQRLKGIEDSLEKKVSYKIIHQEFSDKLNKDVISHIESKQFDAVICAADIIASGVIRLAARIAMKVAEDFTLIGFDDVYYASILQPALTTIRQDADKLAKKAIAQIKGYIDKKDSKVCFQTQKLPTKLIIRESTKVIQK